MKGKTSKNLLSRRETLRLIGAAGATALVGWKGNQAMGLWPSGRGSSSAKASSLAGVTPQQTCVVRPQLTEGPYFVDERLNRSDIRTDPTTGVLSAGQLLTLRFNVSRMNNGACTPLPGALLDVWHCDAVGTYSDVTGSVGRKFLRGYQVTDSSGAASFTTVYPGWYSGRAVHIHFKIRLFTGNQTSYEFTSQLFFDDSFTDQIYTQSPYNTRGARNTRNSQDGIYNGGGSQLILNVTQDAQGYAATFDIALTGITLVQGPPPEIAGAAVSGKQLIVVGSNFDSGAVLLMDGEQQKKTGNDEASPTTMLIARKSGKRISPGQTVTLQVRNSDNTLSNAFPFTRPVE